MLFSASCCSAETQKSASFPPAVSLQSAPAEDAPPSSLACDVLWLSGEGTRNMDAEKTCAKNVRTLSRETNSLYFPAGLASSLWFADGNPRDWLASDVSFPPRQR